jgi:F-type H+-transporting ATPase subunit alpha
MLADIALSDVSHFESELFDYLTATKDELLTRIKNTGVLSSDDEEELRSAINTVKKKFNTV